jgi:signal transduction histidine kinase
MRLHEFMSDHREEILQAIQDELTPGSGPDVLDEKVCRFFDEMVAAIRRDSGLHESVSPLPGYSDTAAQLGAERQRAGVSVLKVPAAFAAISQAVAKTGELYELQISAEEYKMLNRCLDAGIATSLEHFCERERTTTSRWITERYGHMAHELRNALGNVNMAFKVMRAGDLRLDGRTGDVLGRNLARMAALVAQCLGSVQVEAGRVPPLVPVHVADVLRDVEASSVPDRGVSIVLEVDEVLFIRADEMLFSSAMSNLVHNAVKFSHPGATVRVYARAREDQAVIDIEDECGGLGQRTLAELCEPYRTERSSAIKGIGLGLAITKEAVEAMHGVLSVTDRPGLGCVFSAHFPLYRHGTGAPASEPARSLGGR